MISAVRIEQCCSTLQRSITVLAGFNLDTCLVYLDDIILISPTPEEHHTSTRSAGPHSRMRINTDALQLYLLRQFVCFLGHVASAEDVATDSEIIRLVEHWSERNDLGQLRSFWGLAGYYRKYVEGHSLIASPLTMMTKKGSRFVWTVKHMDHSTH